MRISRSFSSKPLARREDDLRMGDAPRALEDAGLSSIIRGGKASLTAFVPTNAAFEAALAELGVKYPRLPRDKSAVHSVQGVVLK